MAVATHLADKSALARMDEAEVTRRLGPMIEAGLVGTCGIIELEVRFSARSHTDYEQISRDRGPGYESFAMSNDRHTCVLRSDAARRLCGDRIRSDRSHPR